MAAPTITVINPTNNATNVDPRDNIEITFSVALDTDTITEGTVVLTDDETGETVGGAFSFSSSNTVVTLLPAKELRSNVSYTLMVVGADIALPAGAVQSSTSDDLATSSIIHFRVKTERFVSLEEITDRTDLDHVAPIREEAELALSTNFITLTGVTPDYFSTNNADLSQIVIAFSETLDTVAFDADTMFSIEMNPILDLDAYYGNLDRNGDPKLYLQDSDLPIALPTGTVLASSNTLTWTRTVPVLGVGDHPQLNTFPFNAELIVTVDASIIGSSGNTMSENVNIIFTTKLFPMFSGSRTVRLDVGPSLDDYYDDTINRLVLQRSIEAWRLTGGRFSLESPVHDAILFTRWGSVLDAAEIISFKADLARGTSKQLGSFSVDFSNRAFAKSTGRFLTAKEKVDSTEYRLMASHGALRPKVANLGSGASMGQRIFRGVRNWDSLVHGRGVSPIANTRAQRRNSQMIDQGAGGAILSASSYFSLTNNGYLYLSGNT